MPFPAPGDLPDPGTEARICCTGRRVLHLSRSLLVDGFELSSPIPSTGVLFKPVRLQAPFSSRVDPPPICREGKLKPLLAWLALRLCLRPHPCFIPVSTATWSNSLLRALPIGACWPPCWSPGSPGFPCLGAFYSSILPSP